MKFKQAKILIIFDKIMILDILTRRVHPPGNGFSRALESRFLVPKNKAHCS